MIYKATEEIELTKEIFLEKTEFINDELKPNVKISFNCCSCSQGMSIEIIPYQTGFPFQQIYKNKYLSKEVILKNKIASVASRWATHFGEYLVYDLPTLYFIQKCTNCNSKYFIVFGLGESQPSKWVCKISCVWKIN